MGRLGSAVILILCAGVGCLAWWRMGQAVAVPDAPVAHADCVSYAPFRGSESPLGPAFIAPPERLASDMALLASFTDCVRTYGTANGLDQVPAAAKAAGLQVMQGIWIGRNDADNAVEMERGIALAKAYPETIRAVVVGNEALLRREITPERLAALIDQVKAQVPQPVTYADVWEFWHQAPSLAAHVDFVTIHLLPYWEDHPAAIDDAIVTVTETYNQMAQTFADRPLLIGEIGWPSIGRQRQGAEASLVNETRFIRGVIAAATEHGWRYNLIESFDQPWKRALEGTTGGYWGLFDQDRTAKVTLHGPVVELPTWSHWAGAGAVIGVLLAGLALVGGRRDGLGVITALSGGLAAGQALSFLARYLLLSARNPMEWAVAAAVMAVMVFCAWTMIRALRQSPHEPLLSERLVAWARRLAVIVGAVAMVGHLVDARYRDFPLSMFIIPTVGALLLRWGRGGDSLPRHKEDTPLALVLIGGAVYVAADEGWLNDDALAWAATVGLLGTAVFPWAWVWQHRQRAALVSRGLP